MPLDAVCLPANCPTSVDCGSTPSPVCIACLVEALRFRITGKVRAGAFKLPSNALLVELASGVLPRSGTDMWLPSIGRAMADRAKQVVLQPSLIERVSTLSQNPQALAGKG